ncbi:MAG: LysE family translocator [Bauldia sp.]|nr:LysE family translocator [Bauldia sp.]
MPANLFAGFVVFALVTLFTPGPNNIMLMTSGLNYGLRRALPHLFGVAIGFGAMVLGVGIGLGAVFETYPALYPVIKYVGVAYLLYLAWVIATASPHDDQAGVVTEGRPISFLQAAAFQWVNPKAWVMAVGAVATYAAIARFPFNMAIIAGVFASFGIVSSWTWIMFGSVLRRFLRTARAVRLFNIAMGVLLVVSILPVLVEDWL